MGPALPSSVFVSGPAMALGVLKNVWRRKRYATEAGGC